jgi:hypothetical protein
MIADVSVRESLQCTSGFAWLGSEIALSVATLDEGPDHDVG